MLSDKEIRTFEKIASDVVEKYGLRPTSPRPPHERAYANDHVSVELFKFNKMDGRLTIMLAQPKMNWVADVWWILYVDDRARHDELWVEMEKDLHNWEYSVLVMRQYCAKILSGEKSLKPYYEAWYDHFGHLR